MNFIYMLGVFLFGIWTAICLDLLWDKFGNDNRN